MEINIVYHWAPTIYKEKIIKEGLQPYSRIETYINPISNIEETWSAPYICCGFTPLKALYYVIDLLNSREIENISLFEIYISHLDEVIIRNDKSNELKELRIFNTISNDRIHYVGDRSI